MKAVICREPGGAEVLEIAAIAPPEPGPGEVLVRNFATALNRADLLQRRGLYPPPPGASEILGLEFAGEVAKTGRASETNNAGDRVSVGDRVFGLVVGGAYAEFLAVPAGVLVPIPDHLSYDLAAAIPEAFYTAHEALLELAQLKSGEMLVVHAGASGVGCAAIQLARRTGATVIATAGSLEKVRLCEELGANRAVNYREQDFVEVVRDLSSGEGADVILDLVGAKHWDRNLESLRVGGRYLVVGLVGGRRVQVDLGTILKRRLRILGTAMRGRSLADKTAITARFVRDVLPQFAAGTLRPVLDQIFTLDEVRAAHERMEANLNLGKIVLRL